MTTTQQQMREAEEYVATARRKRNLESNPYDLVNSKPIATNFGNKFNRNAPYVKSGALDVPRGSATYTKTVKYHDFERRIVGRNPLLFDDVGDIVEEESSDEEGDKPEGEYFEPNPYSSINLEELLAPLEKASDLPTHPRLSRPYEDKGLLEMIRNAEVTLHKEQEKLRELKEQFIRHRGDVEWAPVGDMHTEYDDWLLATMYDGTPLAAIEHSGANSNAGALGEALSFQQIDNEPAGIEEGNADADEAKDQSTHDNGDVSMLGEPQMEATATAQDTRENEAPQDNGEIDRIAHQNGTLDYATPPKTNGTSHHHQPENDDTTSTNAMGIPDAMIIDTTTSADLPNTQRMTTRALANSSTSDEAPPPVHPFFIHPPPKPMAQYAVAEEDPLGMLLAYTSKQAEVVRQWETLHQGLLQAARIRDNVHSWAKAEGHVGEMSDGEDWVDLEEWGLAPGELKKGKDEDEEVQTVEGSGRRGGRGRRGGGAGGGTERGG